MPNDTNRQASIDSRRIALERQIAIRVPRFDSFVTEYSSNISTTGMFIVSDNPQPPGTTFTFEFSVADDWKLIRGKAQVIWTRYRSEGDERPAGMGVRFIELDAQSRRLIRWIVEKHIREGGKPFELDELRSVIDEALEQVLDPNGEEAQPQMAATASTAAAPAPSPRKSKAQAKAPSADSRFRLQPAASDWKLIPLILSALLVLALVGGLFWLTEWYPRYRDQSAGEATQAQANTADADAATEPVEDAGRADSTPSGVEGETADATGAPAGSIYRSVSQMVAAWANAWTDQDVERYLSYYSSEFTPNGGLTRDQWAAQRRQRVAAPQFLKVSVTNLDAERLDQRHARAQFTQNYRSDRFGDLVDKTLDLVWEDERWKIAREFAR